MVMHVEFFKFYLQNNYVEHHDLRQMCKREQHVCVSQSSKVQVYPQDAINVIIQKLNPLHLCMCNEQ